MDEPGLPALPVQGAMLGIPQDAQPKLQVLSSEWTSLPGEYDLCPTPQPVFARSTAGPLQFTSYRYERAPEYQLDAFTPSAAAEPVSIGSLRSQYGLKGRRTFRDLDTRAANARLSGPILHGAGDRDHVADPDPGAHGCTPSAPLGLSSVSATTTSGTSTAPNGWTAIVTV